MEKKWEHVVSREEVMKKLIKYAKLGYNHVTFLWGEPFIHPVLHFATRFAKKLWYTTLVTTNASTLQFEAQAKKHLPSIDQIFISVPVINTEKQLEINQTKWIINFDNVFANIKKHWSWNFLKVNTVINHMNLDEISDIIRYLSTTQVTEISLTYPDLNPSYYGDEYITNVIAPKYTEVRPYLDEWYELWQTHNIRVQFVDIPFCIFPSTKFYAYTDDFMYQNRLKINAWEEEWDRDEKLPRARKKLEKCGWCMHKTICWWPSTSYARLYGDSEIIPITESKDAVIH